jgi:hypothetical protein
MKSVIFWIVTLCISEKAQYFRGTYSLHLQCQSLPPSCLTYSSTMRMERMYSRHWAFSKWHSVTIQMTIPVILKRFCIFLFSGWHCKMSHKSGTVQSNGVLTQLLQNMLNIYSNTTDTNVMFLPVQEDSIVHSSGWHKFLELLGFRVLSIVWYSRN